MTEPPRSSGLVAVPAALAADANSWAQALQAAAGNAFRALYVHGSALTSRFDPIASDVNLLLVVADLPFERLEAVARVVRALAPVGKKGRRWSPLVLTEPQIRSSLDVFPAEFLDLLSRRALVAGADVLAELEVGRENLRHQCEYELRSKLLGLRQAYLLSGAAPGVAHRLLVQSAGGLSAVYRHLLTLRGQATPEDAGALVAAVAAAYGGDLAGLGAPFTARAGRSTKPDDTQARARFAEHVVALDLLIGAVDAFPTA